MTVGRHHVGDHVPVHAGESSPHEDLPKDYASVPGRRAGGDKGRALVLFDIDVHLVRGRHKGLSGERVGGHLESAVKLTDIDRRVDGDNVTEIDGPSPDLSSGSGSAVGDALHLGQILLVVFAQEKRIGLETNDVPT